MIAFDSRYNQPGRVAGACCDDCGRPTERDEKFGAEWDTDGDKVFVGADVCHECGWARTDRGEVARRDVAVVCGCLASQWCDVCLAQSAGEQWAA